MMDDLTEDGRRFLKAYEEGTKGVEFPSTGPCPHCVECQGLYNYETLAEYDAALESGAIAAEPHFSWHPCEICGSHLGGDREEWHYVQDGKVYHGGGVCVDCVCFMANGDVPERWEG